MVNTEYEIWLSNEDKLKIKFSSLKGKVQNFVVQYYAKIKSKWRTIMRIDNNHGYPHKHIYYLHSKEFKLKLNQDNNSLLSESKEYIRKDFLKIKENFLNS